MLGLQITVVADDAPLKDLARNMRFPNVVPANHWIRQRLACCSDQQLPALHSNTSKPMPSSLGASQCESSNRLHARRLVRIAPRRGR
jgi:hypothetical protein